MSIGTIDTRSTTDSRRCYERGSGSKTLLVLIDEGVRTGKNHIRGKRMGGKKQLQGIKP